MGRMGKCRQAHFVPAGDTQSRSSPARGTRSGRAAPAGPPPLILSLSKEGGGGAPPHNRAQWATPAAPRKRRTYAAKLKPAGVLAETAKEKGGAEEGSSLGVVAPVTVTLSP